MPKGHKTSNNKPITNYKKVKYQRCLRKGTFRIYVISIFSHDPYMIATAVSQNNSLCIFSVYWLRSHKNVKNDQNGKCI